MKFEPGDFECIVGYHSEDADQIAKLVNKRIAPLVAKLKQVREDNKTLTDKCSHFTEGSLRGMVQKLEQENKRLTYQLDMGKADLAEIHRCHEELTALKAKLEVAVEALKQVRAQHFGDAYDVADLADKAIVRIEELGRKA